MHPIRKQAPFILAALLLCLAVTALFPYCRYYIDPDATAYLTIAKRYAAGDYARAVNGYWSPLSCWLTAIGIRLGCEPFSAAIIVNTLGALGFLGISDSFFLKYGLAPALRRWMIAALVVFLASAVYFQSFADLWQCFLLLTCFRIMLSERFAERPGLWCLYGITGALAYFAKAYSFSFFILNTVCCGYLVIRGNGQPFLQKRAIRSWVKVCGISLLVFLLCSSPWLWLLHEKYGSWMTSTAGKLNLSWYLVGHPLYTPDIAHFLPPVYGDSPYYWEDPWFSNGETPQLWSSPALFRLQLLKTGYNLLKLAGSLNHFSAFAIPAWLLSLLILLSHKVRAGFPSRITPICLSILIFPGGFLLINFEPRYIWYTFPLTMLVAGLALQQLLPLVESRRLQGLIRTVFALSFMTGAISNLLPLIHEGKADYEVAQRLKQLGIKGSFAGNADSRETQRRLIRIAYFSGNPYYLTPDNRKFRTQAELDGEMKRYGVRYYFCLTSPGDTKCNGPAGSSYHEAAAGRIPGLQVYSFNP